MDANWLFPIGNILISLAVASISYRQWSLARHKLKLDLYDRRYKVYEETMKFLDIIMRLANFNSDDLRAVVLGTRDANFLFGTEIERYVEQVRKRAIHMQNLQRKFQPLPVGEERSKLVNEEHIEIVWLTDQLDKAPKVFARYLSFANVK